MSAPATLGELVVSTPGAAELFERLGLDYCCDGARSLDEACQGRGVDAATVRAMLEHVRRERTDDPPDPHDMSDASLRELCEHIVVRHHGPLRVALTRLTKLLETVARVHGASTPTLVDLQGDFGVLRADLEQHLLLEERTVFPACARLDNVLATAAPDEELLDHLRDDHQDVGAALARMRGLCEDYDESRALCATHGELLRSLHAFELDLHQHIHEENNVLFPRVMALVGPGLTAGRDS